MNKKLLVTFGPAYAPVDGARRITNQSTGSLGAFLCDQFVTQGYEVIAFRGEMAVNLPPKQVKKISPFSTNQSLQTLLEEEARAGGVTVVFHLAALCDFELDHVADGEGHLLQPGEKIKSHHEALTLVLRRAPKILPSLRQLFPAAVIIGWKYELDGIQEEIFKLGMKQVTECGTDLCVVNGKAYGKGYGICSGKEVLARLERPGDLVKWLADFLKSRAG